MADLESGDGLTILRRWVVITLLVLLSFVTVAELVDAWWFRDSFHTDPAFYTLVGGMVAGLFAAEALAIFRRRGGD